jgi:hypothetical protein
MSFRGSEGGAVRVLVLGLGRFISVGAFPVKADIEPYSYRKWTGRARRKGRGNPWKTGEEMKTGQRRILPALARIIPKRKLRGL